MKVTASLSLLFGLAALTQGQSLEPSPTESVGCVPHDDHWHCDGPRVTSTGSVPTPTPDHPDHDDDDVAFDHDDADKHLHTTPVVAGASTATLKPSPTESFGCEPHGDHWHCEGSLTAATTLTGSGFTSVITPAPTTAADATSTAGAGRSQVTGLAVAGLAAAAAAVALAI